jgi:DNA-binding transcriptional LysR family regulator
VVAGVGVSLVSASFANDEVRSGEAKLLPLRDNVLWRSLGLIYRSDRTLPRSAQAFVELTSRFAKKGTTGG